MNLVSSFKNFLLEAKLPKTFPIKIDNDEYKVIRTNHVYAPRGNSPMGRDSAMSKSKYEKALSQVDMKDGVFAVLWQKNNKSHGLLVDINTMSKEIKIITAILNQKLSSKSLFANKPSYTVLMDE